MVPVVSEAGRGKEEGGRGGGGGGGGLFKANAVNEEDLFRSKRTGRVRGCETAGVRGMEEL